MAIDRGIFLSPFQNHYCPPWPCPTCTTGTLQIKDDLVQYSESQISRVESASPGWEPEWIREIFTSILVCQNKECKEVCAVSGLTSNEYHIYEGDNREPVEELSKYFHPVSFTPPIPLFRVSPKVPTIIKKTIIQSFGLYWMDQASCANRIRFSLELILTDKKVKRFSVGKKGKRFPLALHHRIEEFEKREKQISKSLMAIKFIGNEGSHDGGVKKNDLLDAYDILCHCLEELYDERTKQINKLGDKIKKKRGPLSKIRLRKGKASFPF